MPSKANEDFSNVVTNLYSHKMSNLDKEVDLYIEQNKKIKQLLHHDQLPPEILFSHISSYLFLSSFQEAVNQNHQSSSDIKNISLTFNFTDYADYLIYKLERKGETGPLLAAKFIKKINSIHPFPKTLHIDYELSFPDSGALIGYCTFNDSVEIQKINQAYRDIIAIGMRDSISQEIEQLNNELAEPIEDLNLSKIAKEFVQHILNKQFSSGKNTIQIEFDEFIQLLNRASKIYIDDEKMNLTDANEFFMAHYKHLIVDNDSFDLISNSFKIK